MYESTNLFKPINSDSGRAASLPPAPLGPIGVASLGYQQGSPSNQETFEINA